MIRQTQIGSSPSPSAIGWICLLHLSIGSVASAQTTPHTIGACYADLLTPLTSPVDASNAGGGNIGMSWDLGSPENRFLARGESDGAWTTFESNSLLASTTAEAFFEAWPEDQRPAIRGSELLSDGIYLWTFESLSRPPGGEPSNPPSLAWHDFIRRNHADEVQTHLNTLIRYVGPVYDDTGPSTVLEMIRAPAPPTTRCSPEDPTSCIRIAVMDTGIGSEPATDPFTLRTQGWGCEDLLDPTTGCTAGGQWTYDDKGHGTKIASVIGSAGIGSAEGVVGVVPIKILDGYGCGLVATAIKALEYIRTQSIKVTVGAWYFYGENDLFHQELASSGTLFVAPAPECRYPPCNLELMDVFPTSWQASEKRLDNMVVVGGLKTPSQWVDSHGPGSIDIAGPAVKIKVHTGYQDAGTSLTAGLVAGAAARILAKANSTLSIAALRARLVETASGRGIFDTGCGGPCCNNCGMLDMACSLGLPAADPRCATTIFDPAP